SCRRRRSFDAAVHGLLVDAAARHRLAGRPRSASRQIPQDQYLAPADGVGTSRGICRRSPRRYGDRGAVRLAGAPRQARAAVLIEVDAAAPGGAKTVAKIPTATRSQGAETMAKVAFVGLGVMGY